MRTSRARFKHALRWCHQNEEAIRSDRMAQHALGSSAFWREKGKQMSIATPFPARVGDCCNSLDERTCGTTPIKRCSIVYPLTRAILARRKIASSLPSNYTALITPGDVCVALDSLDPGKAAGPDNIAAECLLCRHPPQRGGGRGGREGRPAASG